MRIRRLIDWLRAGYPEDAPRTGHSPLLALNGPMALTMREIRSVVSELDNDPASATDIGVAITKATHRLPNQGQVRAVALVLPKHAGQPLAHD